MQRSLLPSNTPILPNRFEYDALAGYTRSGALPAGTVPRSASAIAQQFFALIANRTHELLGVCFFIVSFRDRIYSL